MQESVMMKDVYSISERELSGSSNLPTGQAGEADNKNRWTRIGVGFVNRDNSINVVLDAIPLNGRFQIRDRQHPKKFAVNNASMAPMGRSHRS